MVTGRRYWRGRLFATADHLIPQAFGGGNGRENIVAACRDCNEARGAEMPEVRALLALVVLGAELPEGVAP